MIPTLYSLAVMIHTFENGTWGNISIAQSLFSALCNINNYDLRTGRCVCSWVDPCDATLYCIASDNQYTMITGTQYNCLAILWDQRKNDFVQVLITKLLNWYMCFVNYKLFMINIFSIFLDVLRKFARIISTQSNLFFTIW